MNLPRSGREIPPGGIAKGETRALLHGYEDCINGPWRSIQIEKPILVKIA